MSRNTNLDTYNPNMPEEIREKVIRDNFKETKITLDKAGVNLLVDITDKTGETITNTAYQKSKKLIGVFKSSGGFIEIDAVVPGETSGATIVAYCQLVLNGGANDEILDMNQFGSGAGAMQARAALTFKGNLPAGNYRVNVEIKVSGGSVVVATSAWWAKLMVKETLF